MAPDMVAAAVNEKLAVSLRLRGASLSQIAPQLAHPDGTPYTREGARQCIKRGLAALKSDHEEAEELKAMMLERWDVLRFTFFPKAEKGDEGAFDRVMHLDETTIKTLGLAAPVKINTEGKLTLVDERAVNEELADLLIELNDRLKTIGEGDGDDQ